MRKFTTKMIFLLLLSSFILPFFPVTAKPTPAQIPRFKIGEPGDVDGNWDGPIGTAGFQWTYSSAALESLFDQPPNWDGDYDKMIPRLATNWTFYAWPEEMNQQGFINRNGLKAVDITLRDDVKFHDGSDWNATVAKWNFDRTIVIAGNITGKLTAYDADVYKSRFGMWLDAATWAPYETDSWNVSQFIGKPATYAEYGSTLAGDMRGQYSRIKNITILDDKVSGGTIRINFNDWGGAGTQMLYVYGNSFVSMDAYKDYWDTPIYGIGAVPEFPQPDISGGYPSTGFRGHMIGTGAYIFVQHDSVILQGGFMKRNPNWWNATAMQANGWHQIPEIGVVTFALDDFTEKNLAMVTGAIDIAFDTRGAGNLEYDDMIAADDVNYLSMGLEPTRTFITLNAINETDWKTWADMGPDKFNAADEDGPIGDMSYWYDIDDDGTIHIDGINRALRKALSYAFEYDTYINVIRQGRATRHGGVLGIENEFYNPDIPLAYYNLTIARQALLNDPYWAPKLAAKNLDINNATDDWKWVAGNDPIFEFKLMWDMANQDVANVFSTSVKNLGITLGGPNGAPDPALEVQPYLYVAMFFQPANYPFFTSHGVPTNWPGSDITSEMLPSLEYYYRSPGLPFVNGSGDKFPDAYLNLGFQYNKTVDDWLDRAWFSTRTTQQELFDNLTRHMQTYQYPDIFISHNEWGIALNKDWELDTRMWSGQGWGQQAFIKYVAGGDGNGDGGVQIPGFQTVAILAIAVVTVTGIGYSLRKRIHAEK